MKLLHPLCKAAATGILLLAVASPAVSFAHDHEHHHGFRGDSKPQEHQQWVKKHLDREAAMLEIKASQESAWEAYAAAAQELMSSFGERKALVPNADAATTMRQHAEQAAAVAQRLAKLAEATEQLQGVLNDDQRKVLDRIVRMHSHFPGRHHGEAMGRHDGWHHESGMSPQAAKVSPKGTAPAKAKN